jgi:hypothetical protein
MQQHCRGRRGVFLVALAMLLFGLMAGSASAASSHHYAGSFDTGTDPIYPFGKCSVHDLDVDAQENVYVLCGGALITSGASGAVVKKFDKNGNPVPFSANVPYVQGNAIVENPDPNGAYREDLGRTFGGEGHIAVSTSTGATAGYIYVETGDRVEVFNPAGKFVGGMAPAAAFGISSVGTDAQGFAYYDSGFKIDKRDASLAVVAQLFAVNSNLEAGVYPAGTDMSFDSEGNVWGVGDAEEGLGEHTISRWEADQFGRPEQESTFSLGTHRKAKLSPLAESPLPAFGSAAELEAASISVARGEENLLFVQEMEPRQILEFSPGSAGEKAHQIAAPIGDESNIGYHFPEWKVNGLAAGSGGNLFVAAGESEVSKFAPGPPLPTVTDHPAAVADVGHTDAILHADLKLSGGSPIVGCEIKYGLTRNYGHTAPCSPDPSGTPFSSDTAVSAHITGLTTEQTYHYAFVAGNASGTAYGIDQTVTPAAVIGLTTQPPSELTDHSATFNGTLDPDGMATTYHFEYGLSGELTTSTAEEGPITGSGSRQISVPVENLATGQEYQYRLVATNSLGTTRGTVQTFTVAGPPAISGVRATNVRSTDADLNARVDPDGYQTTYRFEYGTTVAYSQVAPAPEGEAGAGTEPVDVSAHLTGLEPGRTYHFRLVATNQWWVGTSGDTTFNFTPQECPNEHVRQQMKSSYLPDCRAYELVSPENAGGAQIYPGSEAYVAGTYGFPAFYGAAYAREIQNTGLATNPPRFAFYAGLGSVGSLDAPNTMLDQYTSTRTNTGWVTTFSGIKGSEAGGTGHKVCSTTLSMCLDHTLTNPFVEGTNPRNWGYLFNAEGEKQGIAPTDVDAIEHGREYIGDWHPSPDFTHLAFSSRNVPFTTDSLPSPSGWAYDDNLQTGAVSLISVLPNGQPIPTEGEFITFPPTGVSSDGSHILMETRAPEREVEAGVFEKGQHYLYLRVDDSRTYEIGAPGQGPAEGSFIGMSSDGTKVLFRSEEQLVGEDTDNGADIYMWEENGGVPTLKLISQGAGQGDSNACKASWNGEKPGKEGCSVTLLETEDGDRPAAKQPTEAGLDYTEVTLTGTDSKLASESGGVFFFSPERLAGAAPHNGKNLYFSNDGEMHYVATIGAQQTIDRIQISPNGKHAGFLTKAKLTSYDNEGYEEMYSYDPASGRLNCVSCIPDGEKPTADVEASKNGPFMANDGRLFFATSDPLVPTDSDPFQIPDVYEYTEGRPQLISSGTSSDGKAPGGAGAFVSQTLGLESVSANGQDVFFSTTSSLVPQDANGHFAKIYDARTNGGFEIAAEPAPCVAADECHGTGSTTPESLAVGTGSNTNGGNVPAEGKKKPKPKRVCKAKGKGKKTRPCAKKSKKHGRKSVKAKRGGAR